MATTIEAAATGDLREIAVGDIRPSPYQPRREFDEAKLRELADSMRESGLLQPVSVRRVRQLDVTTTADYELVAGERRLRAAELLGWPTIPAVVKDLDDAAAHTLALIENLQRDDLSPLEEARAYRRIIAEQQISQVRLAAMLGVPRSTIQARLALTELPAPWDEMLEAGQLTVSQAVELHKHRDADPEKHGAALEELRTWVRAHDGDGDAAIAKVELSMFRDLIAIAFHVEPEVPAPPHLDDDAIERIRAARERDEQETRDREELDRQIAAEKKVEAPAAGSGSTTIGVTTDARCIVCSCTDDNACPGGCSWLVTDGALGVCSACAGSVDEAKAMLADITAAAEKVAAPDPEPTVRAVRTAPRLGIFSALKPLLAERAVNISIAPASGPDALRVNIIPMRLKESENSALFTPLSVEGTAEQLDERLADAVLAFVASRTEIAAGVSEATKTMKDAERAAQLVAQAKAEKAKREKPAKAKGKAPAAKKPAAKKRSARKAPARPFMQPQYPSPALAAVIGTSEALPRTEVTKKLWSYIKRHGLQSTTNRRQISADDVTRPVFGADSVSMFDMTKRINKHLQNEPWGEKAATTAKAKRSRRKSATPQPTDEAAVTTEAAPQGEQATGDLWDVPSDTTTTEQTEGASE